MTANPAHDDRSPQPRRHRSAQRRVIHRQPRPIARVNSRLTKDDFDAAYQIAVSTGDDPALDGLLLRHLLIQATRPSELLALRYGDLNMAEAFITNRSSKVDAPPRPRTQPTTPEHKASLAAHVSERGPRVPAPPNAPEDLRRSGIPAPTANDPVFYRRPIDTHDIDGNFVARQVRPVTRRRLITVGARIRQHGGRQLTAYAVRALSLRLVWEAGGISADEVDVPLQRILSYKRCTSVRRPDGRDEGRPGADH